MKNVFIVNGLYNVHQNISHEALAKNHCPIYYNGVKYLYTTKEGKGLIEHCFEFEGEKIYFDDDFLNNGNQFDNSLTIVEQNPNFKF